MSYEHIRKIDADSHKKITAKLKQYADIDPDLILLLNDLASAVDNLGSPQAVYVNMMRGSISKPGLYSIMNLYDTSFVPRLRQSFYDHAALAVFMEANLDEETKFQAIRAGVEARIKGDKTLSAKHG